VIYEDDSVDLVSDSLQVSLHVDQGALKNKGKETAKPDAKPILLYNENSEETHPKEGESADMFAGLPDLGRPKLLQAPHEIPALFPFHRTSVYLLMAPVTAHLKPKMVILKGTSPQGPLELEIPVEIRAEPDQMIHQLAARKAAQELEEGRGWISHAVGDDGVLIKDEHPAQFELLQRREAVRLGVEFQVGGKYCSFVAIEANEAEIAEKRRVALEKTTSHVHEIDEDEDWEVLENESADASDSSEPSGMSMATA